MDRKCSEKSTVHNIVLNLSCKTRKNGSVLFFNDQFFKVIKIEFAKVTM